MPRYAQTLTLIAFILIPLACFTACDSSDDACRITQNDDGSSSITCADGSSLTVSGGSVSSSATIAPGEFLALSHPFAEGGATFAAQIRVDGVLHDYTAFAHLFDSALRDPIIFAPETEDIEITDKAEADLLKDGNIAVVWAQEEADNRDHLRLRIYSPEGMDMGVDPTFGPSDANSEVGYVALVALESGDFVVAWTDYEDDSLQFQRFDKDGVPQGDAVDFGAHDSETDISLCATDDGFAAAFNDAGESSHVVETYDATGTLKDRIATLTSEEAYSGIQIRRFSNGRFVLARERSVAPNDTFETTLTFMDADGSNVNDIFLGGRSISEHPYIAISPDDRVIVAYEESGPDIGLYGVFESDGSVVRPMNQFTHAEPDGVAVAVLPNGNFIIAFNEDESENGLYNVFNSEGKREASDLFFGGFAVPDARGVRDIVTVGDSFWILNEPYHDPYGLRFDVISLGTLRLVDMGNGEVRLYNHGSVAVESILSATGSNN